MNLSGRRRASDTNPALGSADVAVPVEVLRAGKPKDEALRAARAVLQLVCD